MTNQLDVTESAEMSPEVQKAYQELSELLPDAESVDTVDLDRLRVLANQTGEYSKQIGQWPAWKSTDDAVGARIPKPGQLDAQGMDAGLAYCLGMIPHGEAGAMAARLHQNHFFEDHDAIYQEMAKEMPNPDSPAVWYLAMSDLCEEEGSNDETKFRKYLKKGFALREDPQARLDAARRFFHKLENEKPVEDIEVQTSDGDLAKVPFSEGWDGFLAAYGQGYRITTMYEPNGKLYFVGTASSLHNPNLTSMQAALEGFEWKEPDSVDANGNRVQGKSGMLTGNFVKCSDEAELRAVLSRLAKASNADEIFRNCERASGSGECVQFMGDVKVDAMKTLGPADLEKSTRPERIERLTAEVNRLFPGAELAELREDIIQRSFNVPQWGKYHNEGIFMDTHLDTILGQFKDIKAGKFPDKVPEEIREILTRVVTGYEDQQKRYVMSHDVKKADTLSLKSKSSGERRDISWEDWLELIPEGAQGDPVKMKEFLESSDIETIGYPQHGRPGAQKMRGVQQHADIPDIMIKAIEKHEVAFNFEKINAKTYGEKFGKLTEEEIEWVFTASYVDTMSSLRADGTPDITNFLNLVESRNTYQMHNMLSERLMPKGKPIDGLDKSKLKGALLSIWKSEEPTTKTYEQYIAELLDGCKISIYSSEAFKSELEKLVSQGALAAEQVEQFVAGINENGELNMRQMGPLFGRLKDPDLEQQIKQALADSEIK